MSESDTQASIHPLATPQANCSEEEKLVKLRARLAEGLASPLIEDFDFEEFLADMHRESAKRDY